MPLHKQKNISLFFNFFAEKLPKFWRSSTKPNSCPSRKNRTPLPPTRIRSKLQIPAPKNRPKNRSSVKKRPGPKPSKRSGTLFRNVRSCRARCSRIWASKTRRRCEAGSVAPGTGTSPSDIRSTSRSGLRSWTGLFDLSIRILAPTPRPTATWEKVLMRKVLTRKVLNLNSAQSGPESPS